MHILHICVPTYKHILQKESQSQEKELEEQGCLAGIYERETLQEEVAPISSLVNRVWEGEPSVLWESPTSRTYSHWDGSQNKEEPLL